MKTESKIRFLKIACKTCGMDYEKLMEKAFRKQLKDIEPDRKMLEGLDPETRRALERAVAIPQKEKEVKK